MENQEIKEIATKRMTKIDWLKKILESKHEELKASIDNLIEEYKCLEEIDALNKKKSRLDTQIKNRVDKYNKLRKVSRYER